jgi:HK97 gp10 family phage protein
MKRGRGPKVAFGWKGVEELKHSLEAVGASLDDRNLELKEAILVPATAMAAHASALAPKVTGRLAAACYASMGNSKQRGVFMGVRRGKKKGAPYAWYVEVGTSKMAARPYFRPALAQMATTYANDLAPGVKKIVEATAAKNAHHPS